MMMQNQNIDRELGWDDEIEKDGGEWVLLPEGDYDFVVTKFERARHPGSEKLPACPKAILTLQFNAPQGSTTITHNLFLHTKCEGLLSAFFCAIGQKKHGERFRPNWNQVIGATGRCKLGIRNYKKKDGTDGQNNEIKRFYDKEQPAVAPQIPASAPGAFIPGQF